MKKVGLILLGILMAVGVSAEVKKIKGTGYLVVHDRQADQPFTRVSVQQSITLYVSQGKTDVYKRQQQHSYQSITFIHLLQFLSLQAVHDQLPLDVKV